MAVAVVVKECATCAPSRRPFFPQTGLLGHVCKGAIPIVAKQAILSEVGDEDVVEAVIVVVGDADAIGPTCELQPGRLCDIGEGAVAIIFIKAIGCLWRCAFQASAGKQKDIHPSIVVVVDKGASAAVRFQNVLLAFNSA